MNYKCNESFKISDSFFCSCDTGEGRGRSLLLSFFDSMLLLLLLLLFICDGVDAIYPRLLLLISCYWFWSDADATINTRLCCCFRTELILWLLIWCCSWSFACQHESHLQTPALCYCWCFWPYASAPDPILLLMLLLIQCYCCFSFVAHPPTASIPHGSKRQPVDMNHIFRHRHLVM